jgi:uncharacterized protein (TIGR03067 family)
LGVAIAGDGPEKAVAEELKRLDGEWKIVAAEQGGETIGANDIVGFAGQKCTVTNPATKIVFENTITVDPSKKPKRIELTNVKTKEVWAGIYELEGDKLRCLFYGGKDAKAPTEFKTTQGKPEVMYTYERVKHK